MVAGDVRAGRDFEVPGRAVVGSLGAVTRDFAVGDFTVGYFAVGDFAVGNFAVGYFVVEDFLVEDFVVEDLTVGGLAAELTDISIGETGGCGVV